MSLPSLLAGPPSLWELLDSFFVDLCTAWGAQYLETASAPVIVAETYNPDAMPLPGIIISSYDRDAQGDEAPFGDGEFHIAGMTYDYQLIVCAAFEQVSQGKRFAATASASLLDQLRSSVESLVALKSELDDEYVVRFELGTIELYVRGLAGQPDNGKYTGCCVLAITVYSEV